MTAVITQGNPCKYGHDGRRYRSGACVQCSKDNCARQRKDPNYNERKRVYLKTYLTLPGKREADRVRGERWRKTEKAKRTMRAKYLLRMFGITIEQFDLMVAAQENRCAICRKPAHEERYGLLCIDHDHDTGAVRQLICDACNLGLGRFNDDPSTLEKAAEYLRRHGKV
jgi:hypothetical protein